MAELNRIPLRHDWTPTIRPIAQTADPKLPG